MDTTEPLAIRARNLWPAADSPLGVFARLSLEGRQGSWGRREWAALVSQASSQALTIASESARGLKGKRGAARAELQSWIDKARGVAESLHELSVELATRR